MTYYEVIVPKRKTEGYGIKATKIKIIEDISKNFNAVKKLADTCNKNDVDLDIFPDVLENYIDDYTF